MKVFFTGGTGFVGSFLAAELLNAGHSIIFLARGKGRLSARRRIEAALKFVSPMARDKLNRHCTIIEGDITQKGLGLSKLDRRYLEMSHVDAVYHCAASVDFSETNRDMTRKINVDGTVHTLEMAHHMEVSIFHHMSTLYVAGAREGKILETELTVDQRFNNPYEETKAKAEAVVKQWSHKTGIPSVIYRLPIVLGHSATGKTPTFSGFYGFFKAFWRLAKTVRKRIGSDPRFVRDGIRLVGCDVHVPLYVNCTRDSRVDLVPIDWVTRMILSLSSKESARNKTFHLSHPKAPSSLEVIRASLPVIGLKGLIHQEPGRSRAAATQGRGLIASLQRMLNSITERYFSYATSNKIFDDSNLRATLGSDYTPPPLIDDLLIKIMLGYAISAEFKPPYFV